MTDAAANPNSSADALASQLEQRLIAQEYKIWKKNTPFLYDYVMTHGLEWPSLTCQWLPTRKELNGGHRVGAVGGTSVAVAEQHELLVGTHTAGGEPNYLMVVSVNLPREDAVIDNRTGAGKEGGDEGGEGGEGQASKKRKTEEGGDDATKASNNNEPSPKSTILDGGVASNYNEEKDELGGYTSVDRVGKIDIKMKIPHDGEVNRARCMPQNHFVVATRGPSSDVYVWDMSRHSSFPPEGKPMAANPQVICRGHDGEGYGVAWCGVGGAENQGRLVTCAEDKTVCLWNVNSALKEGKNGIIVEPEAKLTYHTDVVEDVDWHNRDAHLVGSCGDDRLVCLWDCREGKRDKPVHVIREAHAGDVNGMEFHPTNEFYLATGGSDKVVKVWDQRNLKSPLQTLEGHTDQVYAVRWSPHDDSVLASCAADRRVALWDLSRVGAEQSPEDAEDGPPELLFLHGGHTSRVNDFAWNPKYEWCVGGVSEDNVMQVWSPNEDVYADEGEYDDDEGGEEAGGDLATKQRAEILGDDELE